MTDRRPLAVTAAGVAAALALVLGACSSEPKDPAEQRKDRVQERMEDSFSKQQAECIVSALDQDSIDALDRSADLDADASEMQTFSDALAVCVLSSSAISTTTVAPDATTPPPGE